VEIKNVKTTSGNQYSIVSEYWENSRAWGHRSVLLRGGDYEVANSRVRYYNRTWEMYTYQSCMSAVVYNFRESELNRYIRNYKEAHNVTRFKSGEKAKVVAEFDATTVGKDCAELSDRIKTNTFD
jgi:hypothetical protein